MNVDDILISARKGLVIARSGKGESYREVPLHAEARKALKDWLKERSKRFPKLSDPVLFLSMKGKRLSTRAIDLVLRQFGANANLEKQSHKTANGGNKWTLSHSSLQPWAQEPQLAVRQLPVMQ